jgi:hypothetical protein
MMKRNIGTIAVLMVVGMSYAWADRARGGYNISMLEEEIFKNIQSLKTAELAYESQFDVFVSANSFPPKPSSAEPQAWFSKASGGFEVLNWQPSDKVLGAYQITTSSDDFLITVRIDIDGDGVEEVYKATKDMSPDSKIDQLMKKNPFLFIEDELLGYMKGIKTAELAYESNFDVFVTAAQYPPEPNINGTKWVRSSSGGFYTLGWSPDGAVRGSYSVTTTTTDFTVLGIGDVDGDGTLETYRATKSLNPYKLD